MKIKLTQLFVTILFIILLLIPIIHLQNKNEQLSLTNNDLNIIIDEQSNAIKNLELTNKNLIKKIYELENVDEQSQQETTDNKNLGQFKITAYCNCSKCCGKWAGGPTASGVMPTAGRTIAVDPKVIPLGTNVIIDGHTYVAEDTGGAIRGQKIDLYCSSHTEALAWGVQYKEVIIVG